MKNLVEQGEIGGGKRTSKAIPIVQTKNKTYLCTQTKTRTTDPYTRLYIFFIEKKSLIRRLNGVDVIQSSTRKEMYF